MKKTTRWSIQIIALTTALGIAAGGFSLTGTRVLAQEPACTATEYTIAPKEELVSVADDTDSEALFAAYAERTLYEDVADGAFPVYMAPRRSFLNDRDLHVYDRLKAMILEVAAGVQEGTRISFSLAELGVKSSYTYAELGLDENMPNTTEEEQAAKKTAITNAVKAEIGTYENVMNALMTDLPYELYWFDKKSGWSRKYPGIGYTDTTVSITGEFNVGLRVTTDFSKTEASATYEADKAKTGATISAKRKAEAIVARYAALPDAEKLAAYRDEICELTEYNHDAANMFPVIYGNPWQLLWVLDEDPETNVVCEGYAKAFQYLCDLSTFASGLVESHIMTGITSGNHMWNVVCMDNGFLYLADITNCDGADRDRCFLKGAPDGTEDTYTAGGITYMYDAGTTGQYTARERRLSGGISYAEDVAAFSRDGWIRINGQWYYARGGVPFRGWLEYGGRWYYMDSFGVMRTGWVKSGGSWYYMNSTGAMRTGWLQDGGRWYYLKSSGAMATGWVKWNGKWYHMSGSGAMQTGWVKSGGDWYYLNDNGAMKTGWLKYGGRWYYLESSGRMLSGTSRKLGGKTYTFNASGVCMNP